KVTGGVITNFAGGVSSLNIGDNGPAVNASLSSPMGVAVDGFHSVFIADMGHNRVRKVQGGVITTAVGDGTPRSVGDGGLATGAAVSAPSALAFDFTGSLLISDAGSFGPPIAMPASIRKV